MTPLEEVYYYEGTDSCKRPPWWLMPEGNEWEIDSYCCESVGHVSVELGFQMW